MTDLVPSATAQPPDLPMADRPSVEEWAEAGERISAIESAAQWWWGDWWRVGKDQFTPEIVKPIIESLGIDRRTLDTYAQVAAAYHPVDRLADVSWTVHRDLRSMAEGQRQPLLRRAAAGGLSKRQVAEARAVIEGSEAKPDETAPRGAIPRTVLAPRGATDPDEVVRLRAEVHRAKADAAAARDTMASQKAWIDQSREDSARMAEDLAALRSSADRSPASPPNVARVRVVIEATGADSAEALRKAERLRQVIPKLGPAIEKAVGFAVEVSA